MKRTQPRASLYTFGVVYFDASDRVLGAKMFFTHARTTDEARKGLNSEGLFAIGPEGAIVAQCFSARDVICAEFRRPVTIEARKWNVTERVVLQ